MRKADRHYGYVTRRDCELVDEGWHRFWMKRGLKPPMVDSMVVDGGSDLTAAKDGLQKVTKRGLNGDLGGK